MPPDAEAAYFDNYNHGEDQFGREVLNPAGVDLRLRVARRLGLGKYRNAWVYVRILSGLVEETEVTPKQIDFP